MNYGRRPRCILAQCFEPGVSNRGVCVRGRLGSGLPFEMCPAVSLAKNSENP